MLSCLFIAALWSPAGKRANLLARLYVKFSCVLSLSHVVSGTGVTFITELFIYFPCIFFLISYIAFTLLVRNLFSIHM